MYTESPFPLRGIASQALVDSYRVLVALQLGVEHNDRLVAAALVARVLDPRGVIHLVAAVGALSYYFVSRFFWQKHDAALGAGYLVYHCISLTAASRI